MPRTPKWKREAKEALKAMSNEELFEAMLTYQSPDDYDGVFTDRGHWYADYSTELVRERLKDWLTK
jgi:hypothetical protein